MFVCHIEHEIRLWFRTPSEKASSKFTAEVQVHFTFFSRKRPRRVPSKKALPLKTVIKDCHVKIVIKHRPKFS